MTDLSHYKVDVLRVNAGLVQRPILFWRLQIRDVVIVIIITASTRFFQVSCSSTSTRSQLLSSRKLRLRVHVFNLTKKDQAFVNEQIHNMIVTLASPKTM
jgi:hypothetical protein